VKTIPIEIERLARLVPGYDPFANAIGYYLDHAAAKDAVDFVERCCTHIKGKWSGEKLLLEDWQKAIIVNLFGWKRDADGSRRYREVLVFIPRKNGKTLMAAAIVCLVLFTDGEAGAECYSSAAEREQARLCFEVVQGMIRNNPLMKKRAELFKFSVVVGSSSYKALSAEAGTKHGFNAHLVVNDELHAHKTPELTEVLMTSTGSRTQPIFAHLTTSDYEREGSVCNDKHDYACKVRDGVLNDPAFLPVIFEASRDADWTDEKTWEKANPNIDISISRDYLRRECQRAREDPAYENTFKRLHLNIRTEALDRWITTDKWDACQHTVSIDDVAGMPCWCGLDLASSQDFNAFVVAVPRGEEMQVFPYFWVPEETAAKRERERRITYSAWEKAGLLTYTPGDVSDPETIYRDIIGIIDRYQLNVREIAVDRAFQGLDLIQKLGKAGFTAFAHGQGSLGMIPPTKVTKDLILSAKLKHDGNAVLRWMMSNVVVHPGEGKEYPMKDKSADKIDGAVAMVMAVGRAAMEPQPEPSFYDSEGFEYA
jgi:phage terminase large subunit-like protein